MEFFCQYNLCVQKYLLNHVISEKLSNITCTNVLPKFRRRYTHTPWNLSNEFYKTTMCCFFVFFLNNFLKFKCMPVLFISWEKKMVKTTFARRRHAWSWKYPVFTPLSNPSRFHERLPFISDHFFENNISLKNTHWIYISTVFIKKKIFLKSK